MAVRPGTRSRPRRRKLENGNDSGNANDNGDDNENANESGSDKEMIKSKNSLQGSSPLSGNQRSDALERHTRSRGWRKEGIGEVSSAKTSKRQKLEGHGNQQIDDVDESAHVKTPESKTKKPLRGKHHSPTIHLEGSRPENDFGSVKPPFPSPTSITSQIEPIFSRADASASHGSSDHTHNQNHNQDSEKTSPDQTSSIQSPDFMALNAAIGILQIQRQQALVDLQTLEQHQIALRQNPQDFVKALRDGKIKSREKGMLGMAKPKRGRSRPHYSHESDGTDESDCCVTEEEHGDDDRGEGTDAFEPVRLPHLQKSSPRFSTPKTKKKKTLRGANADIKQTMSNDSASPTSTAGLQHGRKQSRSSQIEAKRDAHDQSDFDNADLRLSPLPIAQSIVRCPPINWAKYHILGAPLDQIHAREQAKPSMTRPIPSKDLPPNETLRVENTEKLLGLCRTQESVISAPYDPWKDTLV